MHGSPSDHRTFYQFRIFVNGEQQEEFDPLGFDDLAEVWHEGAMSACEIIRAMHCRIEGNLDWRLDVADESGKVIYRFSFKAERLESNSDGVALSTTSEQQIYGYVEDCLKLAAKTPDRDARAKLREMAANWLRLVSTEVLDQ